MKLSNVILIGCILIGLGFLLSLGFWQMNRLAWKEGLIAQITDNMKQPPLSVAQMQEALKNGENIRYRPVNVEGEFLHQNEAHYFATYQGSPGYFVHTPLKMQNGGVVVVNRGFVPVERKAVDTRKEGQVSGMVSITGLGRLAPDAKPNSLIPDNDLAKNIFYWKSLDQMISLANLEAGTTVVPFFVDAGPGEVSGGLPKAGTTRIQFPNNHLQYALTWFGLAGTLVVVGGFFVFARSRSTE